MFGILKKDSFFFLIAMLIIYPSIIILWKICGKVFDMQFAVLASFLLHFLLYGPMIINEQEEDKSNGYAFLSVLPVKLYEIVFAKFFFVFVLVLLLVVFNTAIFSFTLFPVNILRTAQTILVISGVLCLIVSAVFYLGVFLFGFSNFFRFGVLLFGVIGLSAGVVIQFLFMNKVNFMDLVLGWLSDFIHNVNIFVLAPSGIVIYFILMLTAVKVKAVAGVK